MDRPRLIVPDSMSRRRALGLGAAAAAAFALPGCSRGRSDEPAPGAPATLATGNKGGVYYKFGAGLATLVSEVTGVRVDAGRAPTDRSPTSQTLERRHRRHRLRLSDSALAAYEGLGEFQTGALTVHGARPGPTTTTCTSWCRWPRRVKELDDLKGMIVSVGPEKSGTKLVAEIGSWTPPGSRCVTRALTWSRRSKQLAAARRTTRPIKDGIDAMIWSGGLPTEPIAELQRNVGFRLVDIGAIAETDRAQALRRLHPVSSIPPSIYALASAVATLAVPNYLIARPKACPTPGRGGP